MKSCKNLKGGLQEVATELEVARIGPQHQAGSDSLLTGQTFFKMKEMFFEDDIDDSKVSEPTYLCARTLRNSIFIFILLENQISGVVLSNLPWTWIDPIHLSIQFKESSKLK